MSPHYVHCCALELLPCSLSQTFRWERNAHSRLVSSGPGTEQPCYSLALLAKGP